MGYRITSLIAFEEVLCNLGERQKVVLKAIQSLQPCSNLEISKFLGIPINSITPRCQELREKGLVIYYKKDICKYTNRLVYYWIIPNWISSLMTKPQEIEI